LFTLARVSKEFGFYPNPENKMSLSRSRAMPPTNRWRRRDLLKLFSAALLSNHGVLAAAKKPAPEDDTFFGIRGVVLLTEDLTLRDWPERAKRAGLTTIALHDGLSARKVERFIQSEEGSRFLERCRQLNLNVEYELHAMSDLLPRDLFARNPDLFRMDEKGERTADANLCVNSGEALQIAAGNAVELARLLRPATGRYFLWGDDARSWCRCSRCRSLTDSDQALVVTNALLHAIQKSDPKATMAHLAYGNTLQPPQTVRPHTGVFVEFAPINRHYTVPVSDRTDADNRRHLDALDANLEYFGRTGSQVLEYWLDVSRFSKWKKPVQKLPFDSRVLAADLEAYGSRNIRSITSFAAYLDADYVEKYGEPPLDGYGRELQSWRPCRQLQCG
jgi:hypothetical protein